MVRHEKSGKNMDALLLQERASLCVHSSVLCGSERCGELTWQTADHSHGTFSKVKFPCIYKPTITYNLSYSAKPKYQKQV